MYDLGSLDERLCKRMNKRYRELAGMLKEEVKGNYNQYQKVISMFATQVGLRRSTAEDYGETLQATGLIIMKEGSGDWYYNEDAEWDLFSINI